MSEKKFDASRYSKDMRQFIDDAYKVIHVNQAQQQKPVCECCKGTGVGPVNSNFAGQPCLVCRGM